MYFCMSKQLVRLQDFFGVLSRLFQRKGSKTFSHFRCLRWKNGLGWSAVELLVRFHVHFIISVTVKNFALSV